MLGYEEDICKLFSILEAVRAVEGKKKAKLVNTKEGIVIKFII